jgi:acyl-CoA thioesterase YciA
MADQEPSPKPPKTLDGPQLRTVAMPRDANPSGDIFGGWTISQMDLAGATFAAHHAGGRVATVSIEAMRFLRPISVGDEVFCYCALGETGETSIGVRIETWARERGSKASEKVTEGVFTFVALDENGKPRPLAGSP